MRQEGGALVGQRQPARSAGQQRGLQLLFQPAQRAAHARDSLAELFGGGGDRAAVDHRAEGEQFFEQLGCSVIPSSTRRANLQSNLAARDLRLTGDDMARIGALDQGERIADPAGIAPDWD